MRGSGIVKFLRHALFTLAAMFIAAVDASARSYEDILESGYISVAIYRNFPPYSFEDSEGEPAGIDVDIARRIAKGMGLDIQWFWVTVDESLEDDLRNAIWKGATTDPDKRVADIMMRVPYDREYAYARDGYGLPKHERVVMFSPYHQESWLFARDLEQLGDVRTLAVFQYEKVGVEIETLPDFYLLSTLGGRLRNNVMHYMSIFDALDDLKLKKVAAVVGLDSQLRWWAKENGAQFDLSGDGLQTIAKRHWDIGIAADNRFRELTYVVGDEVTAAIADGTVAGIFAKYHLPFTQPSTMVE